MSLYCRLKNNGLALVNEEAKLVFVIINQVCCH